MSEPVVIVCVRDPDASNSFTVYGEPEPVIIDVDLGYADLTDVEEFLDWSESQVAKAGSVRRDHPARTQLLEVVDDMRGTHHAASWPDLDALLVHLADRLDG